MARARNIKPGFFKNEELAELPFEYRLLFIGLWTLADREGRLEDRPKRIRMEIFPGDDVDCEAGLQALEGASLIRRYEADGHAYIDIPTFATHQKPHPREHPSAIPECPDGHTRGSKQDQGTTKATPRYDQGKASDLSSPAESLLSESPLPLNHTVGLLPDIGPAVDSRRAESASRREAARRILAFLNDKAGRNYQPVDANLDMICARLKDGATEGELRQVIVRKSREWSGRDDMEIYLRPATLFNRTKFAQYQGELVVKESSHG